METNRKRDILVSIAIAIVILVGISLFGFGKPAEPKSAEGMTEEQREKSDKAVLSEGLSVENIQIDYASSNITVSIPQKSTEQYIDDKAEEVLTHIKETLDERRSDMTLEKDADEYKVRVMSTDFRTIVWR